MSLQEIVSKATPGMTWVRYHLGTLGQRSSLYGVWEQVGRELHSLNRSRMAVQADIACQEEWFQRLHTAVLGVIAPSYAAKRRDKLDQAYEQLIKLDRQIEWLIPVAEALDEMFGSLSEEERNVHELQDFTEKALTMAAIDIMSHGRIGSGTIRLVRQLPGDYRAQFFQRIKRGPEQILEETAPEIQEITDGGDQIRSHNRAGDLLVTTDDMVHGRGQDDSQGSDGVVGQNASQGNGGLHQYDP